VSRRGIWLLALLVSPAWAAAPLDAGLWQVRVTTPAGKESSLRECLATAEQREPQRLAERLLGVPQRDGACERSGEVREGGRSLIRCAVDGGRASAVFDLHWALLSSRRWQAAVDVALSSDAEPFPLTLSAERVADCEQ
jgi:hypothetical protein